MVPGVNWKVDLRPFEGVARAPHDTTTRQKMVNVTLLPIPKGVMLSGRLCSHFSRPAGAPSRRC